MPEINVFDRFLRFIGSHAQWMQTFDLDFQVDIGSDLIISWYHHIRPILFSRIVPQKIEKILNFGNFMY